MELLTSESIDLKQELEKYFGFNTFKGEQEERRVVDFTNSITDYKANFRFSKPLAENDEYDISFIADSGKIEATKNCQKKVNL